MPRPTRTPWKGQEPLIDERFFTGRHGGFFEGLWHERMISAWRRAWESCLIEAVQHHGGGLYTVPSQSEQGRYYAINRYPLAPDGYIFVCECSASEKGGVCCAHVAAVYLFRLRHVLHWRLKKPGDDQRHRRDAAETA